MTRITYVGGPGKHKDSNIQTVRVLQEICFGAIYETERCLSDTHLWIARSDGCPVAFASLTVYPDVPETAFLSLSGVIPSARGQGLQRKLIVKREAMCKKLGITRIISYASYDNIPSANNLIKCGYLLYEPTWEWGVKGSYYFQKKLEVKDGN